MEACDVCAKGKAESVRPLHADHKETDTRPILHAKHATKDMVRVGVQSPDNNVLVLSVSHCKEIGCRLPWFQTGFKDRIRYIRVNKSAARLAALLAV